MKSLIIAAAAFVAFGAAPALAQEPTAGKISVHTTPIGEIIKNPDAKAALEKAMPPISQFYEQIGAMTLEQVMPMSNGQITEDSLKALQAEFDKIK